MSFGVSNDRDADAEAVGYSAFGNGFGGVVSSLRMNVGKEFLEQLLDIGFRENKDEVDSPNGGDQVGASLLTENGAACALEVTQTCIGIHGDEKDVAFALSAFEITNVADVKSVKAAVGENQALAGLLGFAEQGAKFVARDDFGLGSTHGSGIRLRSGIVNGFAQFGARNGGSAAFHHDEATRDVCDVGSLERSCTAGKSKGVGGENGVSRAGDIDGLIATVDGDVSWWRGLLEKSHAVFAASDEEGAEVSFR